MKAGTGWKRTTETLKWSPRGANEIRYWVKEDSIATGLTTQWPPVAPGPSVFHMWKRGIFSIFFGDFVLFSSYGGGPGNRLLR